MANQITCPKCGSSLEDAVAEEYKKSLQDQMIAYKQQKDEEFRRQKDELVRKERQYQDQIAKQELEYQQRLNQEKAKLHETIEVSLKQRIAGDYETRLRMLQESNKEIESKLEAARRIEVEYLQKEQVLKNKEQEVELTVQKKLQEERKKLQEDLRAIEEQRLAARESEYQFRLRELEKQLEDQKKLADEMRRKAEQGSMQLQGEVQELLLEQMLREYFPMDVITEVGKGAEGADCIQIVRTVDGVECGKLIYESKRSKAWQNVWVSKLKADMRNRQADLAILVTQTFPKDMKCFGERDGVWICSFQEVMSLATALRNAIIRISETQKLEENKGEKMAMLYQYLTGLEFRQKMEAIVEGFVSLRDSITREKIQMEKMWKEREKQLEKVLLSTAGMYGSIKGIAGASVNSIPLLEGGEEESEQ